MIRKFSLVAVAVALAAVFAYAQTENKTVKVTGYVIDNACAEMHGSEDEAKDHSTSCALMPGCEKSGYAVISGDKSYKLDAQGNKLAADVLRHTHTKKGVKVEVEGTLEGDTLHADKLAEVK
jgi:type 1 fimbria pilin